jgi:hypothetical protein
VIGIARNRHFVIAPTMKLIYCPPIADPCIRSGKKAEGDRRDHDERKQMPDVGSDP